MTVSVMLVDDNPDTLRGYNLILGQEPKVEVVAEAHNGEQAVSFDAEYRPDVTLMDVRMPKMDGIEAAREILSKRAAAKVLVLTTFDIDEYAFQALAAGASGFLLKDATPDQLVAGILAIADGDAVITPRITRKILNSTAWINPVQGSLGVRNPALQSLTPREREVASSIAEGFTNREIADKFFISEKTVKTYVTRILRKTGARDRVQIVLMHK